MTDLADKLQPGIRYMQNKLQEVHDYLDNMGPTIRLNTGWQPIETAPKTKKRILAIKGKTIKIVVWYPNLQEWGNPQEWDDDGAWKPTHWMPLPEPPEEWL